MHLVGVRMRPQCGGLPRARDRCGHVDKGWSMQYLKGQRLQGSEVTAINAVLPLALSNSSLLTYRLPDPLTESGAAVHDGVDVLRHVER